MVKTTRGAAALAALALAAPAMAQNNTDENAGRNAFKEGLLVHGTTAQGAPFDGTLVLERFEAIGGQVVAVGKLFEGTRDANEEGFAVALPVDTRHGNGGGPGSGRGGRQGALELDRKGGALAVPAVFTPGMLDHASPRANPLIQQAQATCDVLDLVLGPINLDLLGLVVDLNQVVLNIDAQAGPGNLLGNLLCAVTNLLNGFNPNLAGQLANVLNAIANLLAAL